MSKDPHAEAATALAADSLAGAPPAAASAYDRRFFGHPAGLANLFFTELFERFSYYGMRALLVLFMTAAVTEGGLGYTTATAALIYGLYTSLVYLVNLPGGWIADRLLGQRRSVLIGGTVIAAGHFTMAIPGTAFFFAGLGLIVVGTGLLKPNISVMVGQLYAPTDARRDAGFTIFYMGINIGAFIAPLVCGYLGEQVDWHLGFAAAGVGMALGLVVYVLTGRTLGEAGRLAPEAEAERPSALRAFGTGMAGFGAVVALLAVLVASGALVLTEGLVQTGYTVLLLAIVLGLFGWLFTRRYWTDAERRQLYVIGVLFIGAALFWAAFEQAGSSLNLFAEGSTARALGAFTVPASFFQSLNPLFIMAFAPVVAAVWVALARRGMDPSSPAKFALGLLLLGLGFVVMIGAAALAARGQQVSPMWLVATYLLHTLGELTLSPVGLSAMTRLAPARVTSLMMGVWFLAASVGNFVAGFIATFYDTVPLPTFFGIVAAIAIGGAVVLALFVRPMREMMARPAR
ncbi:MAG: peptide MFS transporter [Rubricoccaceae bacterium]